MVIYFQNCVSLGYLQYSLTFFKWLVLHLENILNKQNEFFFSDEHTGGNSLRERIQGVY